MTLPPTVRPDVPARPSLKPRWRPGSASWLGLAALLAAAFFIWRDWRGPQVVTEAVVRRDFVQSVVASGRVETPNRVEIGSQLTGTVARVAVAEGDAVRAGQVLIELESTELRAIERQAEVAVATAQARLRQLREVQAPLAEQAARLAQLNLANAQSGLRRNRALFADGFIGQAALDEAQRQVDAADTQALSARRQLDTAQASGSDAALAQAGLDSALASLEASRARSRYARIGAPVAGTLLTRSVEAGDVVQPGKALLTLSPAGRTQLVVDIDEKNLRLLRLGQAALASTDADPKARFAARLASINPAVNAQTGAVAVRLDVDQPPALLRQDMTVSIDIEVSRRPQALLAPLATLRNLDAADASAPWVLRVEGSRVEKRELRIGLRSGGWVEVLDGLAAGDALLPANAGVELGARVRVAPTAAAASAAR